METLYKHQLEALDKMRNGCILCGDVGSGKSKTALAYYYLKMGGSKASLCGKEYYPMDDPPKDLYIVTTARKRDTLEWEDEMSSFLITKNKDISIYQHTVVVDSWNNIKKYADIKNSFFIFDEQRVIGSGTWVKAFLKITKSNEWILLSATPGDTWMDYLPIFMANGFFRTRSEFYDAHVVWQRGVSYPKVKKYYNEGRLLKLKSEILIEMEDMRQTVKHDIDIFCDYDKEKYFSVYKNRWNPFDEKPIKNASEWCYLQRKVVNSDESRQLALLELLEDNERAIIFYNFDYEFRILKDTIPNGTVVAEWNGHRHEDPPIDASSWVFLVQYNAGSEGWNCVRTDTIIFYSENYSYRIMKQAKGRIDRINTPFKELWYYHLKTHSPIDNSIGSALRKKRNFNAKRFTGNRFINEPDSYCG